MNFDIIWCPDCMDEVNGINHDCALFYSPIKNKGANKMDHVINGVQTYFDIELELLYREWESGEYAKLSDCPSYESAKAMRDAILILDNCGRTEKRRATTIKEHIEGYMWCYKGIKVDWKKGAAKNG